MKHEREQLVFWRDPALPMIEGRQALSTRRGYRSHTHPTWSFGVVDAGSSVVRLGPHRVLLQAGQVVVIPPECVHACNPRAGSGVWSYRMFYVSDAWLRGVLHEGQDLLSVLPKGKATSLMQQVQADLCGEGSTKKRERTLGQLLGRLLSIARRHRLRLSEESDPVLERLKVHLQEHALEKVPLRKLTEISSLSRYQIIRLFRKRVGLTPHAYQVDQRIVRSRELLKRGHSLAEVAYATGFADQSHFQRSFKPRVAVTPADYRPARSS